MPAASVCGQVNFGDVRLEAYLRERIAETQAEIDELEEQITQARIAHVEAQSVADGRVSRAVLAKRAAEGARRPVLLAKRSARIAVGRRSIISRQLRHELEASPEMQAAQDELTMTRQFYHNVRLSLVEDLHDDEAYVAAVELVRQAQRRLEAVRGREDPSQSAVTAAARELLDRQSIVSHFERDVFRDSPAFLAARLKWIRAVVNAVAVRTRLSVAVYFHQEVIEAEHLVEASARRVADAEARLEAAETALKEAEIEALSAINAANRMKKIVEELERDRNLKLARLGRLRRELFNVLAGR